MVKKKGWAFLDVLYSMTLEFFGLKQHQVRFYYLKIIFSKSFQWFVKS